MKRIYQSSFYLLLSLSFAVFWFYPCRAQESHGHEHGEECSVCDDHSDHNHDFHDHQANDSARKSINKQQSHHVHDDQCEHRGHDQHHGHKHTGPVKCQICGHDHDESEHNKELEMIKYETLEGKEESLYKRAATMVALAIILGGINFFFKIR